MAFDKRFRVGFSKSTVASDCEISAVLVGRIDAYATVENTLSQPATKEMTENTFAMYAYLLGFGSNLGDREENVTVAIQKLTSFGRFLRQSENRFTEPLQRNGIDTSKQAAYLNACAIFESRLHPFDLYQEIIRIEDELGHPRHQQWQSREIDIDVLFVSLSSEGRFDIPFVLAYENGFTVPHYGFWERPFLVDACVRELGVPREILEKHSDVRKTYTPCLLGNA